ncbi:putative GPI-anchored protein pfl2 [Acanthaster planci]|uniref:GPI-anchored protein pfl2 n=1 Tax=Acanthaster planci TaxID=133434 RepID=A0A8B7YB74_ACAPL|nr:putative GPI-anchored protein pfl2 [Acanthaster planci]
MALGAEDWPESAIMKAHFLLMAMLVMASTSPFATQTDSSTKDTTLEVGKLTSMSSLATVNTSTPNYPNRQTQNDDPTSPSKSTTNVLKNQTTTFSTPTAEDVNGTQIQSTWKTSAVDDQLTQSDSLTNIPSDQNVTASASSTENTLTSTSFSTPMSGQTTVGSNLTNLVPTRTQSQMPSTPYHVTDDVNATSSQSSPTSIGPTPAEETVSQQDSTLFHVAGDIIEENSTVPSTNVLERNLTSTSFVSSPHVDSQMRAESNSTISVGVISANQSVTSLSPHTDETPNATLPRSTIATVKEGSTLSFGIESDILTSDVPTSKSLLADVQMTTDTNMTALSGAPSEIENVTTINSPSPFLSTLANARTSLDTNPTVSIPNNSNGPHTFVSQPSTPEKNSTPPSSTKLPTNSQSVIVIKPTTLGPNVSESQTVTTLLFSTAGSNTTSSLSTSQSPLINTQTTRKITLSLSTPDTSPGQNVTASSFQTAANISASALPVPNSTPSNISLTTAETNLVTSASNVSDSTLFKTDSKSSSSQPTSFSPVKSQPTDDIKPPTLVPNENGTAQINLTTSLSQLSNGQSTVATVSTFSVTVEKNISAPSPSMSSTQPIYNQSTVETTSTISGWNDTSNSPHTTSENSSISNQPLSKLSSSQTTLISKSTFWGNVSTPRSQPTTESDSSQQLTTEGMVLNSTTPMANISDMTLPPSNFNTSTTVWTSTNDSGSTSPFLGFSASTPVWTSTSNPDLTSPVSRFNESTPTLEKTDNSASTPPVTEVSASTHLGSSTNNLGLTSSVSRSIQSTPIEASTDNSDLTSPVPFQNASTPVRPSNNYSHFTSPVPDYNESTPVWTLTDSSNVTSPIQKETESTFNGKPLSSVIPGHNASTSPWVSSYNANNSQQYLSDPTMNSTSTIQTMSSNLPAYDSTTMSTQSSSHGSLHQTTIDMPVTAGDMTNLTSLTTTPTSAQENNATVSVFTSTFDNTSLKVTRDTLTTVTYTTLNDSLSTVRGDNESAAMSTQVTTSATIDTNTTILLQERSFEGVLRVVSFKGVSAIYNSSLEDPTSSFYQELKSSVEKFVNSIFTRSSLTRDDYLECIVRNFSNGSVVVNFGALLRPTSTVTEGDLESVATTILDVTQGTFPGSDITVDPAATSFRTTTGTPPAGPTPTISQSAFSVTPPTTEDTKYDNSSDAVSTLAVAPATNISGPTLQLEERSFEGMFRIVSWRGADAVYNSSLADPNSLFYKQLEGSIKKFVDGIYKLSLVTRDDYLGSTVRRFNNGSVLVNFGLLFRPTSTVTIANLKSLATTILEATQGTLPGTDITVDPAVTTFTLTNECELEIDDCSMYALCRDLGADGFTCQCLPGTVDTMADRPGRLCLYPTTLGPGGQITTAGLAVPTEGMHPTTPGVLSTGSSSPVPKSSVTMTTESATAGKKDEWEGWQIGLFVLGVTVGILLLAAVIYRLAVLRRHCRYAVDPERRDEQARAERAARRDRSWSFMYRRPDGDGTPDPAEYTDGGFGGSLLPADGRAVTPTAPPLETAVNEMNETGVQTDPVPGESSSHRVGGDGMDQEDDESVAHGQPTSTAQQLEESTSVDMEGNGDQEKTKNEGESTSDGCIVM